MDLIQFYDPLGTIYLTFEEWMYLRRMQYVEEKKYIKILRYAYMEGLKIVIG